MNLFNCDRQHAALLIHWICLKHEYGYVPPCVFLWDAFFSPTKELEAGLSIEIDFSRGCHCIYTQCQNRCSGSWQIPFLSDPIEQQSQKCCSTCILIINGHKFRKKYICICIYTVHKVKIKIWGEIKKHTYSVRCLTRIRNPFGLEVSALEISSGILFMTLVPL